MSARMGPAPSAGKGPATEDFTEAIMARAEVARADFARRARAVQNLAYIPPDAAPALAYRDAVVEAERVYIPLGWAVRLQEGFKLFDTTLSVTYETPAAYKLTVTRAEISIYTIGKEKYETVYGTTVSVIWLPKSQTAVGRAFGLPILQIPAWLAKKYPVLVRMSAKMIEQLAEASG
jgi:hypothetical protein